MRLVHRILFWVCAYCRYLLCIVNAIFTQNRQVLVLVFFPSKIASSMCLFFNREIQTFSSFWQLNPLPGILSNPLLWCHFVDEVTSGQMLALRKKAVVMEGHWTSWKRIKGSKHLIHSFSAANIYFLNGEVAMKYPCVSDLLKSFHEFNFFNVTLVMEHKEERLCIFMVDFWPLLF